MIIIPKSDKSSDLPSFRNGYKIIEDPLRGNCFYKKRIAVDNDGNCRIEKIEKLHQISNAVLFVHCREPQQLEKFKKELRTIS